jgi:hypothetical protein
VGACVATFIALNLWQTVLLFVFGRGQNAQLVNYLANAEASQGLVTIGADNDVRLPMVLNFYLPTTKNAARVRYHRPGEWPPGGVEYFVRSQEAYEWPNVENIEQYTMVKEFRAAPLAGLHFHVYRHNPR